MLDMSHDILKGQNLISEELTVLRDLISIIGIVKANRYVTIERQYQ